MAELVFPPSPTAGDLFPDPALPGVSQWIWDGSRWNLVQGGASVTVSNTPPGNPNNGDLWFDAENLKLFVWYDDGATAQWVVANPSGGGGGGGGPPFMGVTDGSNAAPGEIGEVIQSLSPSHLFTASEAVETLTSITLTPGDWDIQGEVWFSLEGATGNFWNTYCAISISATGLPDSVSDHQSMATYIVGAGFGTTVALTLRTCRATLTVDTPYYLNAVVTFTAAAPLVQGLIWARRMR